MSDVIYLDHAATTPLDERVLAVMQPYLTQQFYNPSAQYLAAKQVRRDVEAARAKVAHWFGARPLEIIFTAGGTESDNLAIHGIMQRFPEGNIVVSAVEHDAVIKPAMQYDCRVAPVKPNGLIDLEQLANLIDEQTVLVSVMYANNELGTIQPLQKISQILADKRAARSTGLPLYFHSDACQAGAYLDLHAPRLGVDLMTINASKVYGPKQVGALYIKTGVELTPNIFGGGQERGLRSGTENVAGVIGLATALELVQSDRQTEGVRLTKIQLLFYQLLEASIPSAIINGTKKQRLPNNIHLTFPGYDNERLMMQLDEAGVQVAVGSACSASSEEPSHVLKAIGLSDADAQASLRITMGHSTTEATVRRVVDLLATFTQK